MSEGARQGRHLAAIMFMDMVGYSARMQENEGRAIEQVRALWTLVRPILARHGGREVDLAGDGMLMEFPGALAAVRCALEVHEALASDGAARAEAERVRVRAGVHLGDIEHRDGRIYGDGVNIAARVIALAPAGAVAMTPHVRDQLVNALDRPLHRLGLRRLKNIKAPLELWCVAGPACSAADLAAAQAENDGAARKWSFGSCTLDERSLELTVAGAAVSLDKRSLDVLIHLLRHAGEVVTREELAAAAEGRAPGYVDASVAQLRAALQDGAGDAIKTVHGFGYRLAAPVSVQVAAPDAGPHFDFQPGTHPPQRPLWSLVERLGSGGHGEAWLARHDKTGELRVFKFALEAAALASLKRETTLYRVLKDSLGSREAFARILDWNFEQAPYFIESEYCNQRSLAHWAERHGLAGLPLAERIELVIQVADALAAAHSVGVLHKDLKPANVLVHEDDGRRRVKLCDFGSGGVLDAARLEALGITRMGFTKTVLDLSTDSTSGTPLYLAPEVVAGQPFTVQADIYALGVMLYQLAVGDLRRGLAPGWESNVADELLREDIAAAADGNPARRLPDPSLLAGRLRALEERRSERARQRAAALQAEETRRKLQRARMRGRVGLAMAGVLVLAALPIAKYYRDAMQARREAEAVSTFLADEVLSMADPNVGKTDDLSFKAVIARASALVDQKLADQPVAAAKVHMALSNSFRWFDMNAEALDHVTRAAALYEGVYGRDALQTQEALMSLVWALRESGQHKAGAALSNEIIATARERWGPDDFHTAHVEYDLAVLQRSMGHIVEPVETLKSLLERAERNAPEEELDGWWWFQYGVALAAAGEFAEAERNMTRAIRMLTRKHGPAHYATAWAEHNHAGLLTQLGRYEEAEREHRQAYEKMAAWKGPDDKQSIIFHARMAEFLVDSGRAREALPLLEVDVARCEKQACDAGDSVSMRVALGQAYIAAGKPLAAVPMLERLAEALAREHVWSNRRLYRVLVGIAEAHVAAGQLAPAQAALDRIPELALRTLPPRHPFLGSYRRIEGLIALERREHERARAALAEAEDIYRFRYGPENWRSRRAQEELARARKGPSEARAT